MTKHREKEFDNLYNFSDNIMENKKIEKKKSKEREKRLKKRNKKKKDQFDFDTETVIGMTNKHNNKKTKQEKRKKLTQKQARILRKKKKIKRVLKWITLFFLIIGGIVFALVSPIFNINEIQVIDNSQISTDTIISLSQLQLGQNIFRFKSSKVKDDVKTNPYVESIKIQRIFPSKVEITIKERHKNYNVEFLNGYAYINNQGYILEISEQKLELPVILGVSTEQEQIVAGNRLNTQDLEKLGTVIQIMNICRNYQIDDKVTNIDIKDKDNYILYLENEKKTINLGNESNLSNKILYVSTILKENEGKEGTIYVDGDINNNFKPRFREKVLGEE